MVFWSGFIKKIKNAVTKERVDKLEQKINTNATNIELVEQDVETNTTNIGTIRNEMIMLKQEDNNIKRRLEQAETNITQTNNELDSLEANVNGFDARITEANTKATSAEEQATRLDLTVSNNSTKITALESKNIKKIEINISEFTSAYSTQLNPGRTQAYYYPISKLNISRDRIISIRAFNFQESGKFSYIHGPLVVWNNWDNIVIWTAQYNTNTEYKIVGYVYIYYI